MYKRMDVILKSVICPIKYLVSVIFVDFDLLKAVATLPEPEHTVGRNTAVSN